MSGGRDPNVDEEERKIKQILPTTDAQLSLNVNDTSCKQGMFENCLVLSLLVYHQHNCNNPNTQRTTVASRKMKRVNVG